MRFIPVLNQYLWNYCFIFHAVISAKCTYHRPYGADSASIPPTVVLFLSVLLQIHTMLMSSKVFWIGLSNTWQCIAWQCYLQLGTFPDLLFHISHQHWSLCLLYWLRVRDWCPHSLWEAPNSTNIPTDVQGCPVQFAEQMVMKLSFSCTWNITMQKNSSM